MKSPDWVGEWFPILESQGEFVQIIFGRIEKDSKVPQWFYLPHQSYDGFGGLTHLLRGRTYEAPKIISRKSPSWILKLFGFLHFLRASKITGVRWRKYDFNRLGNLGEVAWTVFSEAETTELIELAKKRNVSFNSLLLHNSDRALSKMWTGDLSSRRWLIPVSMRGFFSKEPMTANHSSYVSVSLSDHAVLIQTDKSVKTELRKNSHWGAWWMVNSGLLIGRSGMRKVMNSIKRKQLCWMGTFSNLGAWSESDSGGTSWFFCPPVLVSQPISMGCLIWNGRLTLTLQLHPALSDDPARTWQSLESCKDEILRECS